MKTDAGRIARRRSIFLLLLCLGLGPRLFGQVAAASPIAHSAIPSFEHGESLMIRAAASNTIDRMEFLVRYGGIKEYQVRRMNKEKDGAFSFAFITSELPGLEFEYYLRAAGESGLFSYPIQAPEQTIKVVGTSDKPLPKLPSNLIAPSKAKQKFQMPLKASGSGERKFVEVEKGFQPVDNRLLGNGNLRLFRNFRKGDLALNFDANLPYTTQPLLGQHEFDLSNLTISLSKKFHTVRAGDLTVFESDFTINAFGRRGLDYVFDNRKIYLHLFDVSAQQVRGFRGFGIPRSNISLIGGAVGFSLFKNALTTKVIYLSGKDDPGQGQNVGKSYFVLAREGTVMALVEQLRLLKNQLELKAEVARSRTGVPGGTEEKTADSALSLRARYSWKIFNLGAGYRHVGANFNPIGYQYFSKDRRGWEGSLGVALGRLNLTGSYTSEQDNVGENPYLQTSQNGLRNVTLSWAPWNPVSLLLSYRAGQQKVEMKGMSLAYQDVMTREFSGTVRLTLGMAASFNLTASDIDMTNQVNPAWDRKDLTLNLGLGLRGGESFSLFPNLGVTQSTNKFTQAKTLNYNAFLSTEVAFYPRVASFSMTGGWSSFELAQGQTSDSLNVAGSINVYLKELIKIMQIGAVLTGTYQRFHYQGRSDSRFDMRLRFNFFF